ncbi:hypothetical protein [Streptomyces sp. ST2-7A]|uniref:hypothetical protein n=1 Tax=Streptomyces sp. ST2-7A TaxID=2907214 RepID=UPI001F2EA167|nr:hypothetical protein [Streptomyces sp. ST2-7A]MCE7083002.1 hypothetical protein [Streptomyces sp. ST2-7A]
MSAHDENTFPAGGGEEKDTPTGSGRRDPRLPADPERGSNRVPEADDIHGQKTVVGTPGYGGARSTTGSDEPGGPETEFEQRLADMLRRTGDEFRPDTPKLMEGGLRRGRARVWRRRAAMMTGAASLVAVTVAAISLPGGDRSTPVAADIPRTGEDMVETLLAMLPEDTAMESSEGFGPDLHPEPVVWMQLEDGPGSLDVTLALGRTVEEGGDGPVDCAAREEFEEAGEEVECEERRLADGSVLSVASWEDAVSSVDIVGGEGFATRTLEATLRGPGGSDGEGPGGRQVFFSMTKDVAGPEELEGYAFPINRDTLEEVVLAPVWQGVLDEVDVRHGPPAEGDGTEDDGEEWEPPTAEKAAEVREHLAGLLPEGIDMTEHPGEPGFLPGVVLDDGDGAVRADIDFGPEGYLVGGDDPAFGLDDPVSDCVEESRTDGLRVAVCTLSDPEYTSETLWWAHAMHPDGFRVEFTVINAPDHGEEPIREDMPLSTDDLVRVATDPGWREVMAAGE